MNWNIAVSNPQITNAFNAYKSFVLGVATHYAGSRLIEQVDIATFGSDLRLALSNNFDEGFTTIRTVHELDNSIKLGEYGQLSIRLATVQLCTSFEVLFDVIANIYGISVRNDPAVSVRKSVSSLNIIELGNKTIKQIRKLHNTLSIDSFLNEDAVLLKLTAIIEIRNCITHEAGKVDEKASERLKFYGLNFNAGEILELQDNHFDDFLHYMTMNVLSFLKALP